MSYWTTTKISRRSAVQGMAAAGGGLAALSLVGCGGSDKKSTASDKPAALDSTKGKPGGTFKFFFQSYPNNWSPVSTQNNYTYIGFTYNGLLGHSWGTESVDSYDFYNLEPDIAQALPEQPDDNTFIMKLRPGVKFHNGRTVTIEDVRYSLDRVANLPTSVYRAKWTYWLDRLETPDANTIVVKAQFPFADSLVSLAANQNGYILAKEHEEGPEAPNKMMGTGPYIFDTALAPVSITFRKNPDFYMKPYPYFDRLEGYIAADPQRRIADFASGQVHMPFRVSYDEAEQIKKLRTDAISQTWEAGSTSLSMRADRPPFNDKRVRQALSMSIDRAKIRNAVTGGLGRADQFFSMENQRIFDSREPKDLPNGLNKIWEYNPAEAKKLTAAAGFDKPVEGALLHYNAVPQGQWFVDVATLTLAGWRDSGVAIIKDDERTQAQTSELTLTGNFDSMAMQPTPGSGGGAPAFAQGLKDQLYWDPVTGKSPANASWVHNDQVNALVDKQLKQLKLADRQQTYRQMEVILADEMYRICHSTNFRSFFWDPSLRNARMSVVDGTRRYQMKWWFGT